MKEDIIKLFEQGKLLARAMESPSICRNPETKVFSYDFSVWANEYEEAKEEGLGSLSTTLLVAGESIPTYKPIGFLLNSDETDIRHVAETDSGSSGNEKYENFRANFTGIKSLSELQEIIKSKHENVMNEVNVNMSENAYIGLFANKALSQLPIAHMLLAQKYYELQTGTILPMYVYDAKKGQLENIDITLEEKMNIIKNCIDSKILRSSNIFYETERGENKNVNYLQEIDRDNDLTDFILKSAIETTEEISKNSMINEQASNIKNLIKEKDEKSKEMEIE